MKHPCSQRLLPALTALALLVPAAGQNRVQAAAATPDISGVYWTTSYSPAIQPSTGGSPPYKPEAMTEYRNNMGAIAAGKLDDRARSYCVPDGVPRALASPYPFEIVQTPIAGKSICSTRSTI